MEYKKEALNNTLSPVHHLTFISNVKLRWDLLVCWPCRTPTCSWGQRVSCGCWLCSGDCVQWFRLWLGGGGVGCGACILHRVSWLRWKGGEGISGQRGSAFSWEVLWRGGALCSRCGWKAVVCGSWKWGCEGSAAVSIQNSAENSSKETNTRTAAWGNSTPPWSWKLTLKLLS